MEAHVVALCCCAVAILVGLNAIRREIELLRKALEQQAYRAEVAARQKRADDGEHRRP